MNWSVDHILKATDGRLLSGPADATFDGVGIDSRTIDSRAFFVALRGERHDAHSFLDQVVNAGVRGLVIQSSANVVQNMEKWREKGIVCITVTDTTLALGALARYQRRRMAIPVVAITGSNGKTTTRHMTAAVVSQRFSTLATRGNFNNEIGLPLTLFGLAPEHQAAILELGMNHHGEMTRLGRICEPTIGVITNVGPAHIEFLGSLEAVARAKGELIAQVDPGGTMVLNRDDSLVASLVEQCDKPVLFFGLGKDAEVRAENINDTEKGIAFDLILPSGSVPVALATPGRFMVANALAAAAVGHLLGLTPEQIRDGLVAFQPVAGRLQVVVAPNGVHLIDDTYNANPSSMAAALETLSALRKSRPGIAVFGEMLELGDQAEALHHQLGRRAARSGIERLYSCGAYASAVCRGAQTVGMLPETTIAATKEIIVEDLLPRLTTDHWVLVKGSRGAAMETVVKQIMDKDLCK